MPHYAPRSRIQSKCIVRRSDVHDAIDDYGSRFEPFGVTGVEDPGRAQLRYVLGLDLAEAAIALSGVVPVVGRPVCATRLRDQILRAHANDSADGRLPRLARCGIAGRQKDSKPSEDECFAAEIHFSASPVRLLELPGEIRGPNHSNLPGEARYGGVSQLVRSRFRAQPV